MKKCNILLHTVETTESKDKPQDVQDRRLFFFPSILLPIAGRPALKKLLSILYLQTFGGIKCCLSELVVLFFYGLLQCTVRASLLPLFFKADVEI